MQSQSQSQREGLVEAKEIQKQRRGMDRCRGTTQLYSERQRQRQGTEVEVEAEVLPEAESEVR